MNAPAFVNVKEELQKAVYKIEDSICSLILTIADLEKYRRELISQMDYQDKKDIPSLEKAYFLPGPPKMLYILIPAIPPSLNHTIRLKMPKHRYAYSAVFAWWDMKIKNALENIDIPYCEYCERFNRSIPTFSKATIFVKLTFSPEISGDIDNYAIKAIVDSLKKNRIIEDDNIQVFNTFIAQGDVTGGDTGKIELFVTEDSKVSDFLASIYREWLGMIPDYITIPAKAGNKANDEGKNDDFFIKV